MFQPKDRGEHLSHHTHMLRSCFEDPGLWRPRFGSEIKCLLDGQGREMYVVFRAVLNVTTIVLGNFFGCKGIVVDITLDGVILVALIGYCL